MKSLKRLDSADFKLKREFFFFWKQLGKRPAVNTKRRPANSKKGLKKVKVAPLPIEYVARSSMTDQLNQVMDDTLLAYSQSVANKTFRLKVQ